MQGQGRASGRSRELARGASPKAKHTWFCSRPPEAGTGLVCAYQTLAPLLPPPGGESPRTVPRREVGSQVLGRQQEPGLIILRGSGCSS